MTHRGIVVWQGPQDYIAVAVLLVSGLLFLVSAVYGCKLYRLYLSRERR
jgi:hypothetical protein